MSITKVQKQIIIKAEELLKANIKNIQTPKQGMDSEVFFATDSNDKEYAIKSGKNAASDVLAYKLLEENKIDISVPKIFGTFPFKDKTIVILEKINSPLLESIPVGQMYRYIPSMVKNLKKIHQIKSDKAGFLTELDKNSSWKEVILSKKLFKKSHLS